MNINIIQALIIAVFSFGSAIFYSLSCIERPVLGLWLKPNKSLENNDLIRFVHKELKKLIPLLPPSNGFVIFFGMLSMITQCILTDLSYFSIGIILFYTTSMLHIIFIGGINSAINEVKNIDSNGDITSVKSGLKRLIKLHHQGLFANAFTVILQFTYLIIN